MSCGKGLFRREVCICTYCKYNLPRTNYHLEETNPVSKMFWGKVDVKFAASYYYFNKGSKVQKLIHQLKYRGRSDIGVTVGEFFGAELKESPFFKEIDTIIPVPLHPGKQRRRGYNQSECFARGLSNSMKIEIATDSLYRSFDSESQTRKSRFERWKNVEEIFKLKNEGSLINKYILLVDDVVTTGSTLEACARVLLKIPGVKVSVAAIASAS